MNEIIDPSGSYLVLKNASNKEFVASALIVTEVLSGDFEWTLDVLVSDSKPADWIGEEVSCSVFNVLGSSRSSLRDFKGFVVKAQAQSQRIDSTYYSIKLTVQPWLALLKYSKQCRVFQEQTTQAIVTSIFDELGFKGKYSVKSMPSSKREYCVQLNESDYEFVTRLLAEEGVHYYYGKDSKADTLYLQQASSPFSTENTATFDYAAAPSGDYEILDSWQREHNFHSASVELAGYDYNQTKLVTSKTKKSKYSLSGNTKLTEYEYPTASPKGDYSDLSSSLATICRGELDASYDVAFAKTSSVAPCTGHYLKLNAHPDSAEKGSYLVTEVTLKIIEQDGAFVGAQTSVSCTPQSHDFYPESKSKPVIHGLQSAVVAGSTAGEPACDNLGRVRIKFHWDSETGDKTSCWVRVAQGMAGSGYGMQFLPRAGQEVLVSFINGDPDQPVVVSSVYNSKNKPPYAIANTTQNGVKTKLAGESNELRFDDKKDNESFYMHAAKDLTSEVVNDHSETVGGEMTLAVTKNIKQTVDKGYTITAKEDITTKTEKNYALTATKNITEKGKEITLEADDKITLKVGDSSIVITSSKIEISSSTVEVSGDSKVSLEGGAVNLKGSPISVKSSGSMSLKSSSSMALSAGTSLSAKGSTGVSVKGLNVDVKADVGATVKGSATAEISASGCTTVKGGVVMVN